MIKTANTHPVPNTIPCLNRLLSHLIFIMILKCGFFYFVSFPRGGKQKFWEIKDEPYEIANIQLSLTYKNADCLCGDLVTTSCLTLWPHGLSPTRLLWQWNSPGKNTEVGNHSLFQRIFPTRDWTWVSCTAGGFFTNWATREARDCLWVSLIYFKEMLPLKWLKFKNLGFWGRRSELRQEIHKCWPAHLGQAEGGVSKASRAISTARLPWLSCPSFSPTHSVDISSLS